MHINQEKKQKTIFFLGKYSPTPKNKWFGVCMPMPYSSYYGF